MPCRGLQVQRPPAAEATHLPGAIDLPQEGRQAAASRLHERDPAGPGDGHRVDAEGGQRHCMGALLVVEGEARITRAAQLPRARGDVDLRSAGRLGPPRGDATRLGHCRWQWNVQCLRHVDPGLVVHVLVEQCQLPGVGVAAMRVAQQHQGVRQAGPQVAQRLVPARQRQLPAGRVRHGAGVVPAVRASQARWRTCVVRLGIHAPFALPIAGDPPVLEPADVSQLPKRRIQPGRVWHTQVFAQRRPPGFCQGQRARTGLPQALGQRRCIPSAQSGSGAPTGGGQRARGQ